MIRETYQLYLELEDFKPTIWRRIRVPNNMNLAELGYHIMVLFEMQASHLYKFMTNPGKELIDELKKKTTKEEFEELSNKYEDLIKTRRHYELLGILDDSPMDSPHIIRIDVMGSQVADLFTVSTTKATMWYDFGDDWMIRIKLEERITGRDKEFNLLDGENFGIIEDCGGPHGLTSLVNAYKSKITKDYRMYQQWLGIDDFDIRLFDLQDMKERIKRIPPLYKRYYEKQDTPTEEELQYILRR
jgi:hypothetical protein